MRLEFRRMRLTSSTRFSMLAHGEFLFSTEGPNAQGVQGSVSGWRGMHRAQVQALIAGLHHLPCARKFAESADRLAVLGARMLRLRANETGIPFLARASESRYCHQNLRGGMLIAEVDKAGQAADSARQLNHGLTLAIGPRQGQRPVRMQGGAEHASTGGRKPAGTRSSEIGQKGARQPQAQKPRHPARLLAQASRLPSWRMGFPIKLAESLPEPVRSQWNSVRTLAFARNLQLA